MHFVPWRSEFARAEALFETSEATSEIYGPAWSLLLKAAHDDWQHDVPSPKVSFPFQRARLRGGHSSREHCCRGASCQRLQFEKGEQEGRLV
jgi:hypothetical protein